MKIPVLPRRRRRAWGLAAAAVALAAGGIVLSSTPRPAIAGPSIAHVPNTPTLAAADEQSRTELQGPGVAGFFAFTEGAALANGMRELFAELRLQGDENGTRHRAPVSLAVVLDHSGSMSGDKIVQARE